MSIRIDGGMSAGFDYARQRMRAGGSPEEKADKTTTNTDKVDREIEKLRQKKAELEQEMRAERDADKRTLIERELAMVDAELSQKDNDNYRRHEFMYQAGTTISINDFQQ